MHALSGSSPGPALPETSDPTPDAPAELLPWGVLAGLAASFTLLYLLIAPRVMGEGDAAEFTLALALTGAPHPPGYPLYTLGGSVFVHSLRALGLGWAHAANLWSVTGASLAMLFTAALADRAIPAGLRLGTAARACVVATALLALGAQPSFIRAATQAEVYSWEVAWTALAAVTALTLLRRLERPGAGLGARAAFAWGALAGVALAHRPTMAATALPLTFVIGAAALRGAKPVRRALVPALAGALLVAAANGFLLWRASHPAAFQWPLLEPGMASTLRHVSGAYYGAYFAGRAAGGSGGALFATTLLPVFVLAAAAAALAAPRLLRSAAGTVLLSLVASALAQAAFVVLYGVNDFDFFLLPLLVPAVALISAALALLVSRSAAPLSPSALLLTGAACVAAIPFTVEMARARIIAAADANVREAFEALPFERGIVVWNSDSYTRLIALQLLEGRKREVVVLNGGVLTWAPARREATKRLGFDPLEGLDLRTDADLKLIAPNLAGRPGMPVADFEQWWRARADAR